MNRRANGIGSYKRKTSPSGGRGISPEQQARMDAAHRICQERASAGKTPAQAAAVYQEGQAGLTQGSVEVAA